MLTNIEIYSSWSSAPDLPLSMGVDDDEDLIQIREIQGLGPVKANVNTSSFGSLDGEFYTGSNVGKRNIVITVGFNPNWGEHTVASLREVLYGYFMPKQPVVMRFFRDEGPAVEINGITEGCEPNIFAQDPEMQISVICPLPDFVAIAPSVVEGVAEVAPVSSDFTVVGNVEASALLELTADPVDSTTYEGLITFERKTLGPDTEIFAVSGLVAHGSTTAIDSKRGDKTAYVDYGVERTNILNSMTPESVWPRLTPGTNKVRVLLEPGGIAKHWKLTYFNRFGGL